MYGVNSMNVNDYDRKAGINMKPRVIKLSRSPRHDPENVVMQRRLQNPFARNAVRKAKAERAKGDAIGAMEPNLDAPVNYDVEDPNRADSPDHRFTEPDARDGTGSREGHY